MQELIIIVKNKFQMKIKNNVIISFIWLYEKKNQRTTHS
jgi:hypothetical protein